MDDRADHNRCNVSGRLLADPVPSTRFQTPGGGCGSQEG